MLFSGEITIPAGTTLAAPVEVDLKIVRGLITQIDFYFPPGNSCLAFVTVNRARHQIYPTNPDGFIKGNNGMISGQVFHHVKTHPLILSIKGYAPDADYDHTVYFNVWMKYLWQANPFSDEWWSLMQEDSAGQAPFT